MDADPKLEAQRSTSNVYAFRRLKWGDPPEQFTLDQVLDGQSTRYEGVIDAACWVAAIGAVAALVWALL